MASPIGPAHDPALTHTHTDTNPAPLFSLTYLLDFFIRINPVNVDLFIEQGEVQESRVIYIKI